MSELPKMDDLSALMAVNEPQLFLIDDPVTGRIYKGTGGQDMGIWATDLNSPACEEVRGNFVDMISKLQKKGRIIPYEKQKKFNEDMVVAAVTGFQALVWDGEPIEYSKSNVRKLLRKSPLLRKFMDSITGADELFTKGASEKSGDE